MAGELDGGYWVWEVAADRNVRAPGAVPR
jgi:hypothetical protein